MSTAAIMPKLLLKSGALTIWDHRQDPVLWYAAGVPGPFFLNTEWMIGKDLAGGLLTRINALLAETPDAATRASQLKSLITPTFQESSDWQAIIRALAERTRESFRANSFDVLSGGERRDWFFSVPLAHALTLPHLFLFKNGTSFCTQPTPSGTRALHVADLINNAASYFDAWLPLLEKLGLKCAGTVCVNSRGPGAERLEKAGYKVAALNSIDELFFEKLYAQKLISSETREEIATYFRSGKAWAETYLCPLDTGQFGIAALDAKSFERMQAFFNHDPWELRKAHPSFWLRLTEAIACRSPGSSRPSC